MENLIFDDEHDCDDELCQHYHLKLSKNAMIFSEHHFPLEIVKNNKFDHNNFIVETLSREKVAFHKVQPKDLAKIFDEEGNKFGKEAFSSCEFKKYCDENICLA